MDDFVQVESQVLNKMFDFIITNQLSPITHWNEININKPVKGMTEDECLLAFGETGMTVKHEEKPRKAITK